MICEKNIVASSFNSRLKFIIFSQILWIDIDVFTSVLICFWKHIVYVTIQFSINFKTLCKWHIFYDMQCNWIKSYLNIFSLNILFLQIQFFFLLNFLFYFFGSFFVSIYDNTIDSIPWNFNTIGMINCCALIAMKFVCYLDIKIFKTVIYTKIKN